MKWIITGADRSTGADVRLEVDALTKEQAVKLAGRTVLIEKVQAAKSGHDQGGDVRLERAGTKTLKNASDASIDDTPVFGPFEGEDVMFAEGKILVTDRRVVFGVKSHAVRCLASVELRETLPSYVQVVVVAGIGALAAVVALMKWAGERDYLGGVVAIAVALVCFAIAYLMLKATRKIFTVRITNAAGESDVVVDAERGKIVRIIGAINSAVVKNGGLA